MKKLTIKQAMSILEVKTPSTVLTLINKGKLTAEKNTSGPLHFWEIEENSLMQYKKKRDERIRR